MKQTRPDRNPNPNPLTGKPIPKSAGPTYATLCCSALPSPALPCPPLPSPALPCSALPCPLPYLADLHLKICAFCPGRIHMAMGAVQSPTCDRLHPCHVQVITLDCFVDDAPNKAVEKLRLAQVRLPI